jgi:hypothetical protein
MDPPLDPYVHRWHRHLMQLDDAEVVRAQQSSFDQ